MGPGQPGLGTDPHGNLGYTGQGGFLPNPAPYGLFLGPPPPAGSPLLDLELAQRNSQAALQPFGKPCVQFGVPPGLLPGLGQCLPPRPPSSLPDGGYSPPGPPSYGPGSDTSQRPRRTPRRPIPRPGPPRPIDRGFGVPEGDPRNTRVSHFSRRPNDPEDYESDETDEPNSLADAIEDRTRRPLVHYGRVGMAPVRQESRPHEVRHILMP